MIKPVRLRLSRRRGFDLQQHSEAVNTLPAVNVARPSQWGNPFIVGESGTREDCVRYFTIMLGGYLVVGDRPSIAAQQSAFKCISKNVDELRGKNLACWCALDGKPCHADVLLKIANRESAQ